MTHLFITTNDQSNYKFLYKDDAGKIKAKLYSDLTSSDIDKMFVTIVEKTGDNTGESVTRGIFKEHIKNVSVVIYGNKWGREGEDIKEDEDIHFYDEYGNIIPGKKVEKISSGSHIDEKAPGNIKQLKNYFFQDLKIFQKSEFQVTHPMLKIQ